MPKGKHFENIYIINMNQEEIENAQRNIPLRN